MTASGLGQSFFFKYKWFIMSGQLYGIENHKNFILG